MRNANVHYECLDAQDNFHAQLYKGGVAIGILNDIDMDVLQEMEQTAVEGHVDADHELIFDPNQVSTKGKQEKARDKLMN